MRDLVQEDPAFDRSLSTDERIDAIEMRLTRDKARVVRRARALKTHAKVRATAPSSLLFAGSVGFIGREVFQALRHRPKKIKRVVAREKQGGGKMKRVTHLLAPLFSLLQVKFLRGAGGQSQSAPRVRRGRRRDQGPAADPAASMTT